MDTIYEFTKVIFIKDLNKMVKKIENMLVEDCITLTNKYNDEEVKETELYELICYYVSKYTFFIYYLQTKEEYELCQNINKLLTVLIKQCNISDETIEMMVSDSLAAYCTKEKNMFKDEK
jgi:hypothetical protein